MIDKENVITFKGAPFRHGTCCWCHQPFLTAKPVPSIGELEFCSRREELDFRTANRWNWVARFLAPKRFDIGRAENFLHVFNDGERIGFRIGKHNGWTIDLSYVDAADGRTPVKPYLFKYHYRNVGVTR